MALVIIAGLFFIVLLFFLQYFGYQSSTIILAFEWITTFILPWIFLFWLIKLVKGLERKNHQ